MLKNGYKLIAITASLMLASCSLFSSKKEILQGERISVLEQESFITPDYQEYNMSLSSPKENYIWNQVAGNALHNMPNLKSTGLNRKWKADFGKGGSSDDFLLSSPVIANKAVFVMDANAVVSAYRLDNGKRIWKKRLKPTNRTQTDISMKSSGLAVSSIEETVFANTGYGRVFALNMQTGEKIWTFQADTPIRIAPTLGNKMLFVQTIDNNLIALDIKNGLELWHSKTSSEDTILVGGASPAYDAKQDVVIAAFGNGEVKAFKASSGSPLWSKYLVSGVRGRSLTEINAIKSSPIINNNIVYIAGNSDILTALDIRTGEIIWKRDIAINSTMYLANDYLFALSNKLEVFALDRKSGQIIWSTKLSTTKDLEKKVGEFAVGPILINGELLVATSNGYAFLISAASGKIIASTDLGNSVEVSPIVAYGMTIFATQNAKLLAYQ